MQKTSLPKFTPVLITSMLLALLGWGGMILLIQYSQPFLGPRWLFFFLLTVATSGSALPIIYFLNVRFPSNPPVSANVLIRQSVWVAIFFDLLAWLQLGRALNGILILVLAIGFFIIENLIRLVERTRWQPVSDSDE